MSQDFVLQETLAEASQHSFESLTVGKLQGWLDSPEVDAATKKRVSELLFLRQRLTNAKKRTEDIRTALEDSYASQIVTTRCIESKPVDPYMSDLDERIILQRLREPIYISPKVNTLRALPIALQGHLPLVIDERALEEIGLTAGAEFDLEAGAEVRPAGATLRWILPQLDLTFVIRQATVLITTRDAAEAMCVIRIYDVTPLLFTSPQNGRSVIDPAPLQDTIESCVQPDTWERLGGPYTICATIVRSRCLFVVSAPTMVHLDVDQLLNQMDRSSPSFENSRPEQSVRGAPLQRRFLPSDSVELPVFDGPF